MKETLGQIKKDVPYDALAVKEALCSHFHVSENESRLETLEKNFFGSGGRRIHYYYFALKSGNATFRAFGKIAPDTEREYRSLQYLVGVLPEKDRNIATPIALLKKGNGALVLLELLEGYSNPFTMANSVFLFPRRAQKITNTGKAILEKMYALQKHPRIVYSPLSSKDSQQTPGQPLPTSVFKQIESIKSLSAWTKTAICNRINAILENQTLARRGIVHGQMGMRNIMVSGSEIVFIDWEFLENEGLCLYDPCYAATMLLMRSVQLFISQAELDTMSLALFQYIEHLEENITQPENRKYIRDSLWFAKCLGMIDTLWQYEATERGRLRGLLRQGPRRIKYLAHHIERDSRNDDNHNAKGRILISPNGVFSAR